MKGTLIIENVDFKLLQEQRRALDAVLYEARDRQRVPTTHDLDMLVGLQNMLDAWADSSDSQQGDTTIMDGITTNMNPDNGRK